VPGVGPSFLSLSRSCLTLGRRRPLDRSSATCQKRHVSLRNALLGLLAASPRSGYELTKAFDDYLQGVWAANHSQVYPELAKLEAEGCIRVAAEGPRRRKTYAITPKGMKSVRAWLCDTEPDRDTRNEAIMRACFLWLLDDGSAHEHFRREADYHRERLEALARTAKESPPAAPGGRLALDWAMRGEELMIEWIEWAARETKRSKRRKQHV
jgi:PadR family transcriptional regulator, regulatory protein AphA